jgi:ABC-type lipoprotein release transport system permease subunit
MPSFLRISPTIGIALACFAALIIVLLVFAKVPLRYNLRNLVVRWMVTLLTVIVIATVVAISTVLLSVVNGMYKLTEGSGRAENVMVLSDGATDELFSNLGFGDITKIDRTPGVEEIEPGKPLASWETYVVCNQPLKKPKPGGAKRRFVQVRGIKDPVVSGRVHGLSLLEGGAWFSDAGAQSLPEGGAANQAVIGAGIAREMGKDDDKPTLVAGDRFDLGGRTWIVTGVLNSAGSVYDSEVWGKNSIVGEIFGKSSYTTVVMRTTDASTAEAMAEDLTKNFKTPAVKAQQETAYFQQLNTTNEQFLFAIRFVAAIMALGGALGVMITMFAAISQRTKDIGVLRIIGFARWQVLISFFLEAILLAVVAGCIGVAVAMIADGWVMTSVIGGQQGGGKSVVIKLVVDAATMLTGFVLACAMGVVGGLVPALAAMRLRPLESLR